MVKPLKVLNLYAGLGGNRKLWQNVKVTAVELDSKIASVYQRLYPNDVVVIGDAHQYLLDHYSEFDFIWTSPACQSHSMMVKFTGRKLSKYPDLKLYEEIIFLRNFVSCPWVVENVQPYYGALIPARKVGRHLFWSNFDFPFISVDRPSDFINRGDLASKKVLMDWLDIHFEENLYYGSNHCPVQVLRNCVHPLIGQHLFNYSQSILNLSDVGASNLAVSA